MSETICQSTWRDPRRLESSWVLLWEPHLTRYILVCNAEQYDDAECAMYHVCESIACRHDSSERVLSTGKYGCTLCQTANGSNLTPLMHSFAHRHSTDGRSKTNIRSSPKAIQFNLRVVYPQASAVFSVFCGLSVGSWEIQFAWNVVIKFLGLFKMHP